MKSLRACLLQRTSLVQAPSVRAEYNKYRLLCLQDLGIGKSFIGALVVKVLHDSTSQKIPVICFTNHQFLEDLMDIGIPSSAMVRLGGKSTDRTKPLII